VMHDQFTSGLWHFANLSSNANVVKAEDSFGHHLQVVTGRRLEVFYYIVTNALVDDGLSRPRNFFLSLVPALLHLQH